jgi:hypothetical protein
MERYQLTPDTAVAMLAQAARYTRTTLQDVAAEVCRTGHLPEDSNPPVPRPACPADPDPPGRHPARTYIAQDLTAGYLRIDAPGDPPRTGGASIRASAAAGPFSRP